jgi:beta-glucosidase
MTLRTLVLAFALAIGALAPAAPGPASASDDGIARRAAALLAAMTTEEKIAQLVVVSDYEGFDYARISGGSTGNVMNFGYSDADMAALDAAWRASGQKIGMLNGIDMEYGFRTLMPVPIAQAATFDLELNRRAARLMSEDARLSGVDWTMGPMVDVSRDQRWGRTVEGAGEDVLLASCLAGARTLGTREGGQIATLKHFAAHGFAEGAREYGPVEIGEPFLRDVVLPPFRTAIALGADMVMAAFNSVDGVPMAANRRLLGDVLRGEMGFAGPIVSDWEAVKQLRNHGIVEDPAETVALALRSGIDLDMSSDFYRLHLRTALDRGLVSTADLDAAVGRVLRTKLAIGLDRPPTRPADLAERRAAVDRDVRALGLDIARRSVVLLENAGDVLPLAGVKRLAIVGGLADDRAALIGPTPGHAPEAGVTTFREAIAARAARAGVATDYLAVCPGSCNAARADDPAIAEAARRAASADAIVVVIGEDHDQIGEATTRADLRPPPGQSALVRAMAATGRPVVLLLVGGRAQVVDEIREGLGAIVMAWFPGSVGAEATAEILFGDVTPSGRLPFTWPRATGQSPLSYDMPSTARPASPTDRWTNRYLDQPPEPRWPFGWGLTTSTVAYGAPTLDRSEARVADTLVVRVAVTNTGGRRIREVVQLYARDLVASRIRPTRRLVAFEPVDLAPGETRTVALPVRVLDLGFHVENGHWVVEPGTFRFFAGGDARADRSVDVRVVDAADLAPRDEPILCLDRLRRP